MKKGYKYIFILLVLCVATSCQQRYWYRSVVWSNSKPYLPISIQIVNESPFFISKYFEEEIEKACKKQLARSGYYVSNKNAKYHFVLNLKVDSFPMRGNSFKGGYNSVIYLSDGKVFSLIFDCFMYDPKRKWNMWEKENELYFFNKPQRDLRRSKNLVRYMIRSST